MRLTVVSNPESGGGEVTIEPALPPNETLYDRDDSVTLTAVARSGYHFTGWTGDVSLVEDPSRDTIVLRMHDYYAEEMKHLRITANFRKDPSFPWMWIAVGLGAVLMIASAASGALFRRRRAAL